jgi:AmmeMemoRadiSam system protein B
LIQPNPKLRWPLDIQRHSSGSENVIVLTCPLGITEKPLVLVSGVAPLLGGFDGRKSIDELAQDFAKVGVQRSVIDQLLKLLDEHLFLENERFLSAREKSKNDFLNAQVRPSSHAGLTFSSDPQELIKEIDSFLSVPPALENIPSITPLATLVSPHIDYRRGGPCYGRAYQNLKNDGADVYILIGTSHQYSELLFHLTKKDFASPLGSLPCDRTFVETLANLYGEKRSFEDEILHRKEHSLELQVPFISRVKPGATIVPILVGGFHHMVQSGKLPEETPLYNDFVAALCETIMQANKKGRYVTFIAGVDMAHVGKHFGDKNSLTPEFMETVRTRDIDYLEAISAADKKRLFSHIALDNDARKICGFPTMYTILDVAERLHWKLNCKVFDYQQAVDYSSDCAVTFAALGLYHKPF